MHALVRLIAPVATLCAISTAGAAPPAGDVPFVTDHAGLVLVSFDQPNACPTDPWSDALAERLAEVPATATAIVRNTDTVPALLGEDAFRTRGMSIAFRDGERIDVLCGCPDADDLLAWVDALEAGSSWAAVRRAEIRDDDTLDVGGHLEVSQRALCAGETMEAFGELAMLWSVMPERMPDERVLRFNRVGRDMALLARADDAVATKIGAMRDGLEDDLSDPAVLEEWIALNRILLEDDKTIAWFDTVSGTPEGRPLVQHAAPSLFSMLVARNRWADAGTLIGDPLDWLADRKRTSGGLDLALDDHAALAAAGRHGDAKRFARGVLKAMPENPNTPCKLLQRALEANAAHKTQMPLARRCENPVLIETWERAQ